MPKEPKRYPIGTIEEILEIPDDRFEEFLSEVKGFLRVMKAAAKQGILPNEFIWIDDGKGECVLKVRIITPSGDAHPLIDTTFPIDKEEEGD